MEFIMLTISRGAVRVCVESRHMHIAARRRNSAHAALERHGFYDERESIPVSVSCIED